MRRLPTIVSIALVAVLALPAPASARPRPAAASWIVLEGSTGTVLAAHNPDMPLYPASLTKMLTAQVVLDNARPQDIVVIGANSAAAPADHMSWPRGSRFTVEDMLYGMIMMSSNGAAIALAEHIAGTQQNFTYLMRFKARTLGITESRWTTPEGLDAVGQLATARDLAVIARNLLSYPLLAKMVRTRDHDIAWPGGRMRLHARNHFLFHYKGAIGIKPGYTSQAHSCLAAGATRRGRTLIAVVMRTGTPTTDAAMLLDDAFSRPPPAQKRQPFNLFSAMGTPEPSPVQWWTPGPDAEPAAHRTRSSQPPIMLIAYLSFGVVSSAALIGVARRRRP